MMVIIMIITRMLVSIIIHHISHIMHKQHYHIHCYSSSSSL